MRRRISYQRNLSQTNAQAVPNVTNQMLGITPNVPGIDLPPPFNIASGGYTILGGINNGTFSVTNQTQIADQISFSRGRHTMRAGFEWEQNAWPITWSGSRGNFTLNTFNDLLVGGPQNTATGQPGNINQCLFCTRSAPQGIVHGYYAAGGSAFFQDDFKATSRLTLNLGVRWEYNGALNDKYGNLSQIWVSRIQAVPVPPSGPTSSGPGISQWVVPSNFIEHYGQPPAGVLVSPNLTTQRIGARLTNFAPRVGFAYQANNKLVIRGGAGIFYDRVGGDRIVYSVEQGNPYSATLDYNAFNNQSLANPFPTLPVLGTFSSRYANFSPACLANPAVNFSVCNSNLNVPFLDEVLHTPLIRQYNLGFQYQFAPHWVLEIGYVGSSSINLMDMYHNNNTAYLASPANPVNGITTNTTANVLYRVPYLGYQAVGVRGTAFDGYANYNSLQVTVRKQFSRGFTFQGAYTWSKTMTVEYNNVANSNNAGNLAQQYGPATFVRPQRFRRQLQLRSALRHPYRHYAEVARRMERVRRHGRTGWIADDHRRFDCRDALWHQRRQPGRFRSRSNCSRHDRMTRSSLPAAWSRGWVAQAAALAGSTRLPSLPRRRCRRLELFTIPSQVVPDRSNAPRPIRELPVARCTATPDRASLRGRGNSTSIFRS